MSLGEDIAKRYGDEVFRAAPISGVASFVVGVSLQASVESGKSAWLSMAAKDFTFYWYFLDLIRGMRMWRLWLIALASIASIVLFRVAIRKIISFGARTQEAILRSACLDARKSMGLRPTPESIRLGYEKWYEQSYSHILGLYRLGALFLGVFFQTFLVMIINGSGLDVALMTCCLMLSGVFAWRFSINYYRAVLPKRIIMDSSWGLLSPDVLKDLDGIS